MMDLSFSFIAASMIAALSVGMSKGGLPAISMISVPILSFSMPPPMAAGLLLPLYILSDAYGVWLYRREFSAQNLKILMPAGALGTLIGFLTVTSISSDTVKLAVVAVVFYALIDRILRRLRSRTAPRPARLSVGLFWGSLAGLTSYIAHAGAPPYQAYILPQRLPKMVFAGTSTLFFAAINLMKIPPYSLAGQITWASFGNVLFLAPMALLGAWLGYRITQTLSERVYFTIIEVALFLIALRLLYDVFAAG
ncbi:MAG: sulfite exporter TauE/SafE family protein [Pseudomonadota bacterium]